MFFTQWQYGWILLMGNNSPRHCSYSLLGYAITRETLLLYYATAMLLTLLTNKHTANKRTYLDAVSKDKKTKL